MSEEDDIYDVEAIKAKRIVSGRTEYLVKWKGYEEESWEPCSNILDKNLIKEFREQSKGRRRGRPPKVNKQLEEPIKENSEKELENDTEKEKETMNNSSMSCTEPQDIQDPEVSSGGDIIKERPRLIPKVNEKKDDIDETDIIKVASETKDENSSEIREILGATEINGQIYFLIRWRDEKKELEPMCASEANVKYPKEVIAFYEKHFEWISN